jgi:hypothetical protein
VHNPRFSLQLFRLHSSKTKNTDGIIRVIVALGGIVVTVLIIGHQISRYR